MNKRFIKLFAAGLITVSVSTAVITAHASEVSMEDNSRPQASQDVAGSVVMLDGVQPSNGANAGSVNGPKITTAKDKFLVEVGQPFNFKQALGLKIVDPTDGDLTNKLQIPDIPTNEASEKPIVKTIKVTNNKGETNTKQVVIHVVQVAKSAPVSTKEDVQKYNLKKLVNGAGDDLTISLASVDPANKQFTIAITDGVNTLNKKVAMSPASGSQAENLSAQEQGKQDSSNPSEGTEGQATETQAQDASEQGKEESQAQDPNAEGKENTSHDMQSPGNTASAQNATQGAEAPKDSNKKALPVTGTAVTGVSLAAIATGVFGFIKFKRRNVQ